MVDPGAKLLVVMSDLFFSVKINDAAKKLGSSTEFVKDAERALEKAKSRPPLIIVDLNTTTLDAVGLVRAIKANAETAAIPVVGFLSHVQTQLRWDAEQAGCDTVVARSAFAQNIETILQQYL